MRVMPSSPDPVPPSRILAVDDDPLNLRIIHETLKPHYEVLIAISAQDALALVERTPPDLVLLDVAMPNMDGLQACKALKSLDSMRNVPIIFVTARSNPEQETQCFEYGGSDFVAKPLNPPVLKARVQTHLTLAHHVRALQNLAFTDHLTGLHNRRSFEQHLEREHRACMREQLAIGLIIIDVDFFKAYNDHYGHQAGDEALRQVSSILGRALRRPRDFVARIGGEEIACVLPNSDLSATELVAEHLRYSVHSAELPHARSPNYERVTISSGVASWVPTAEDDPQQLVAAADASLYEAKAQGRNRVCSTRPPRRTPSSA